MSFRKAADRCPGIGFAALHQIVHGYSKLPEADTLTAISIGLGIPFDKLALAAYGVSVGG